MGISMGFGAFGLLLWLVSLFVACLALYWVIRLAVRHALRDVQSGPAGGAPGGANWPGPPMT